MKFCVAMRKGWTFLFFMSTACDKEVTRSQNKLKFVFKNFDLKLSFLEMLEYIILKLNVWSVRLYNLFFIVSFCSKSTAQKVRVGRRIFRFSPYGIWKKSKTKLVVIFYSLYESKNYSLSSIPCLFNCQVLLLSSFSDFNWLVNCRLFYQVVIWCPLRFGLEKNSASSHLILIGKSEIWCYI